MKPTFIMMCGLPGSGKSTKAHELSCDFKAKIFSSDEIRKELTGSEECQDKDEEVFKLLHSRIKEYLTEHSNEDSYCIYDACNISYKRRIAFLNELKKVECNKICFVVYTPYEECLKNNKKRNRIVPEYAIKRMYMNFYMPQYYEGWDKICFSYDKQARIKNDLTELFYGDDGLCKIEHENPHHTLSIGDHCIACYLKVLEEAKGNMDGSLCMAALLHDIGKAFTKGFLDSKGEPSETAHYYQHHLVSAYDALPYVFDFSHDDMLETLALIQWHMFPYFWEKDNNKRMENKYKRLWGESLYHKVMKLHRADAAAH